MRFYGVLDLLFAGFYVGFGFFVVQGRSLGFNLALGAVSALLALAGASLCAGARWGRLLGIVACAVLLVFTGVVVILLVASSAYLRGVYGAIGQGIALLSLAAAALALELFGLLPLFQLHFLLRNRR